MENYWAKIERGEYSYYYKGNELLFFMKINYTILGFITKCTLYDSDNNEILSFKQNNFLIGITLKLLKQSLPCYISIKRKNIDTYYMNVLEKEIYLKASFISGIVKNYGNFFINGKNHGKIIRKKKTMMDADFIFDFNNENEINYYCMILFAMDTVGYSNVTY